MRTWALALGSMLLLAGCGGAPGVSTGSKAPAGAIGAKAAGFATARDGLSRAESEARNWDTSARLARIEGSAIENGYLMGDWGYTFYSPFKTDEGLLVIFDGWRYQAFRIRKDPFARPMFAFFFNVDSREALAIAEKNGLASRRVYRIELSEDNPQMRQQWTLQAQEGVFVVDAATGQLLQGPGGS